MSWACPYQLKDFCERLKRPCRTGSKGCILEGKVAFVEMGKKEFFADGKLSERPKLDEGQGLH